MKKEAYAEISEKKTSKLGYLILIALFIFLIVIGQTVFSDIKDIPDRPVSPSNCVNLENIESMRYKSTCSFNEIDRQFGLDAQFRNIEQDINRIVQFNKDINNKQSQLRSNERQLNSLLQKYDISLQETIANEDALLDKPEIRSQIDSFQSSNNRLNQEIIQITSNRNQIIQNIKPSIEKIGNSYEDANDFYRTQIAYYKFKIFLLQLLFVLPFFVFSLYYYLKYKKTDSPYTIIITAIFFASIILFLQIVFIFLYHILPMEWFARIFQILMSISILKYLVYYGSVILVIAILGGIVYYIQKKVYDPRKVAFRHLKDNKCPTCGFNLKLAENFCAKCGRQLKTKCSSCKNLRYLDLGYCPYCGKK